MQMMASLPELPCLQSGTQNLQELVVGYFERNFTYLEIKEFLYIKHGIAISLSTLKRELKKMNLFRRALLGKRTNVNIVQAAVRKELEGSGSSIGYRRVWDHLRRNGIIAPRYDIRKIILNLDPTGVELRKRRRLTRRKYRNPGPNYVWHIDGHDKLKPFGFSIHGCIDGFSRRIIWLEVSSTNKKPELIARYYLDAVRQQNGVPKTIKADDGTEHSLIEPIHMFTRG